MDEQRMIQLETKFAHQEVLLEELHQVLYRQQESIELLEKKMKALHQRVTENPGLEVGPHDQKPPHY